MLIEGKLDTVFDSEQGSERSFIAGLADTAVSHQMMPPEPVTDIPNHNVFIPGRFTREIQDARYDKRREAPSVLLKEALLLSRELLSQDTVDNPHDVVDEISKDVETARNLRQRNAEEIIPHVNWGDATLLDVFIYDQNLPRKRVFRTNFDTNYAFEIDEPDEDLSFRRDTRKRGFKDALSYAREGLLLEKFDQIFTVSSEPEQSYDALAAMAQEMLAERPGPETPLVKTRHALDALDKAPRQDSPAERQKMLNLALDLAAETMETIPEKPSIDYALLRLVMAKSVHDLAVTPGSFEHYMPEGEARNFRVRALELASAWMNDAATTYQNIFNQPIGSITPDRVNDIENDSLTVVSQARYINEAFWFTNIYRNDYETAAKNFETARIRKIGSGAVIKALRPATEPHPTPPGVELPAAA